MNLADLFSCILSIRYKTVKNDASFAFHKEGTTLYILFEKSDSLTDWENNLDFPVLPYRDMPHRWMCHRGFLTVWKSAEPYIADILRKESFSHIVTAGYSHGGALAALCHEYIWFHSPERRASLTGYGFGAPRILWRIPGTLWPKERWDSFTVIRNTEDIVTHLPPAVFGYTHVGKLLKIGKKGRYTSVDAHRPNAYKDSLAELIHSSRDPWHV